MISTKTILESNGGLCTGMLIGAATVLVTLLVRESITFLQPPVPSKRDSRKEPQKQTASERRKAAADSQSPDNDVSRRGQTITSPAPNNQSESSQPQQTESPPYWWTIFNTGAITLFTFFLVLFGRRQWKAMDEQAGHMRNGLKRTDETIAAMQRQISVAQGQLAATQGQLEQAAKANTHTQAIIDHMRFEQRAWVWHDTIAAVFNRSRHFVEFSASIKNFGSTPALVRRTYMHVIAADSHTILSPAIHAAKSALDKIDVNTYWLAPGTDVKIAPFAEQFNRDTIAAIDAGSRVLIVTAVVEYMDAFDLPHFSCVCCRYEPGAGLTPHGNFSELT